MRERERSSRKRKMRSRKRRWRRRSRKDLSVQQGGFVAVLKDIRTS